MRERWLAVAAIAVAVALGYPDVVFESVHPPGDDDLEFVVPFTLELRDALLDGRFPHWNPAIDGGVRRAVIGSANGQNAIARARQGAGTVFEGAFA